MPYLTPPLSVASLNQPGSPQHFLLDTLSSQPVQMAGQSLGAAYQPMQSGSLESEMSLRLKNHICKSFEDDLFFCPRGLLSSQELSTCQQMDLLMLEHLRESAVDPMLTATPNSDSGAAAAAGVLHAHPKFNPYTSQSFSPAPAVVEPHSHPHS
ncbi:LAFE_0C03686g1_1 [Lachancea fermentati]|uniref:LAFE_0C03686g1_1 n=1 Tax=Lachancea fermentati TaxID=4955 RepID=A0A1G4M9N4_LACFM|nr:LAFE_0C03686g1_1 [Lachancea fermentati]